jgi:hypothetical protein
MKNLQEYIQESLLDSFDDIASKIDVEEEIKKFLKDNYYIKLEDCDIIEREGLNIVNINNDLNPRKYKFKTITNHLFKFGNVAGCVDFSHCKLKSLEGCPENVQGFFDIDENDITSLEGSPKFIFGNFFCSKCSKLKSLKGGPEQIEGSAFIKLCGKKFTKNDLNKSNIKVSGEIYL